VYFLKTSDYDGIFHKRRHTIPRTKNEILHLSNGDHIASRIDIPYNTPKKSPDSTVSDNFHTS